MQCKTYRERLESSEFAASKAAFEALLGPCDFLFTGSSVDSSWIDEVGAISIDVLPRKFRLLLDESPATILDLEKGQKSLVDDLRLPDIDSNEHFKFHLAFKVDGEVGYASALNQISYAMEAESDSRSLVSLSYFRKKSVNYIRKMKGKWVPVIDMPALSETEAKLFSRFKALRFDLDLEDQVSGFAIQRTLKLSKLKNLMSDAEWAAQIYDLISRDTSEDFGAAFKAKIGMSEWAKTIYKALCSDNWPIACHIPLLKSHEMQVKAEKAETPKWSKFHEDFHNKLLKQSQELGDGDKIKAYLYTYQFGNVQDQCNVSRPNDGVTLLKTAFKIKAVFIAEELIRKGADPTRKSGPNGENCFHILADKAYWDQRLYKMAVKTLPPKDMTYSRSAALSKTSGENALTLRSAFQMAVENKNVEMAKLMVKDGIIVSSAIKGEAEKMFEAEGVNLSEVAFPEALTMTTEATVSEILNLCDNLEANREKILNARTAKGFTALHVLVWKGRVATLGALTKWMDPSTPTSEGWTPLHEAAKRDDIWMARALLDAGAFKYAEYKRSKSNEMAAPIVFARSEAMKRILA